MLCSSDSHVLVLAHPVILKFSSYTVWGR